MKLATNLFSQSRLETAFTPEENSQGNKTKLFSIFNKVWQNFVTGIIGSNEVRVWQRRDRAGETEWNAYDPATGRSVFAASEAEMRNWIEQSYYH